MRAVGVREALQGARLPHGSPFRLEPAGDLALVVRLPQVVQQRHVVSSPGAVFVELYNLRRGVDVGRWDVQRPPPAAVGANVPLAEDGAKELQCHLRDAGLVAGENRGRNGVRVRVVVEKLLLHRVAELRGVFGGVGRVVLLPALVHLHILVTFRHFHEGAEVTADAFGVVFRAVEELVGPGAGVVAACPLVHWEWSLPVAVELRSRDKAAQGGRLHFQRCLHAALQAQRLHVLVAALGAHIDKLVGVGPPRSMIVLTGVAALAVLELQSQKRNHRDLGAVEPLSLKELQLFFVPSPLTPFSNDKILADLGQ